MKDLKGTKTEKNLETAFAGESMARNKYSFYASKQRKMVLNKLQLSLKRQLKTRRNTPKCGLNTFMVAT